MKIVFINNLYQPYARGGAETVVKERAGQAVDRGDEVIVITLAKDKTEHNQVFWDGKIKIIRIWPRNIFSYFDLNKYNFFFKLVWHFVDIFNWGSTKVIKNILTQEQPDVVETHNLMGTGSYQVHKVLKSSSKWIHYLHDIQLIEPSGILPWNHQKDNLAQKIYSTIIKRRMGNPDEVISPSKFLKDFYQERGFFKSSEFLVLSSQIVIEKNEKQKNLEIKFLFVGSLVKHKGIEILMKAWNQVDEDKVKLNIVGDGDLRAEVEEWAKNKKSVQVLGRLEGNELENIYKQSDVLIMPSICLENRPTVILEAQKYGLQIIASDTGGVKELVNEKDLVEPGNVEELVNKITLISQI